MDEARLVVERVNLRHVTEATLLQMAVSGILDTKANRNFRETIKRLTEG